MNKYPADLKGALNSLLLFCKKTTKEHHVDNCKIRMVIDDLDTLTKENQLLNDTIKNQDERIDVLNIDINMEEELYTKTDKDICLKIERLDKKGKELIKLEQTIKNLRVVNTEMAESKQSFEKEFTTKSEEIVGLEKTVQSEKDTLSSKLFKFTGQNHKLNEEFKYLSDKLNNTETLLKEKLKIEDSLKDTNSLFHRSTGTIKSYIMNNQICKKSSKENKLNGSKATLACSAN